MNVGLIAATRAKITKNGKEAILPLRRRTAELLREAVRKKLPPAQVFALPRKPERMLRLDLARVGVECQDKDGRPFRDKRGLTVGFHSLRMSFATMLDASGAPEGLTTKLMRHSVGLTYGTYTRHRIEAERAAVEALPDWDAPASVAARATGTEPTASAAVGSVLAENLASEAAEPCRVLPHSAEPHPAGEVANREGVDSGPESGWGGRSRTCDSAVNSRLLYRLSYTPVRRGFRTERART